MLNKTLILLFVLMNLMTNAQAASDSTRIGISVEISAQQQCNYSFENEKTGKSSYSQSLNCKIGQLQLQETSNQIAINKSSDNQIRVIKTIQ